MINFKISFETTQWGRIKIHLKSTATRTGTNQTFYQQSHCRCRTDASPSHLELCSALAIHSRQRVFRCRVAREERSTRLDRRPCGEICLALQTAFAAAKTLKQIRYSRRRAVILPGIEWNIPGIFPSQIPDELLDSFRIGFWIRRYALRFPAASVCSRQP